MAISSTAVSRQGRAPSSSRWATSLLRRWMPGNHLWAAPEAGAALPLFAMSAMFTTIVNRRITVSLEGAYEALHYRPAPREAGVAASSSAVVKHPQVSEALTLMEERFCDTAQDGPCSYPTFLTRPGNDEESARLRMQAVMTLEQFLEGLRGSPRSRQGYSWRILS
jgi:hypothetical protein